VVLVDDVSALVARAQSSDADAWETLYRRIYPRLIAYATRRLDPDRARDAVSETMTRAVAKIGGFTAQGGGFEPWLFGICRHVVLDMQRAAGRLAFSPPIDGPGDNPEPTAGLEQAEETAAVRRAFERLSDSDRELLELRVVAGLSADEVAQVLGRRPGAVRMAQSRALQRLRQHLEADQCREHA
jgi:RNA polymerase sigma-70 factor (ECF subfamily)